MVTALDKEFMELALDLARKGRGQTSPNPMVGAVVVRDGHVVGRGYHERAGLPHAERTALSQAGDSSRGATLYVTLEPCCHSGRTPPCTKAIIKRGVRRVVCATKDPNPKIAGRGIRELERAGIEVEIGLMAEEARRVNEVYAKYITTGLPFVSLKIAQTIDGRIAAPDGSSRWISGEKSRHYVDMLRSYSDAVLVGVKTVISDDPALTVRSEKSRNPARIVLDSSLCIPPQSKLLSSHSDARTIIATSCTGSLSRVSELEERGIDVWRLPSEGTHRLDLRALLKRAGQEEMTSVIVEGGSEVFSTFVVSGLADKIYVFIAPIILGAGLPSLERVGIESLHDAIALRNTTVERFGDDMLVTGYPDCIGGRPQHKT